MRVLDREPSQLVSAEPPPKTDGEQGDVAGRFEKGGHVAGCSCLSNLILQVRHYFFEVQ